MKTILLSIAILLQLIHFEAIAQTDTTQKSRNVIYLEVLGIGGYGSLNYERVLVNKSMFWVTARAGISTFNLTDYTTEFNPDIIIPIAINGLYGRKHRIEFGVGQVLSNIVEASDSDFQPVRATNLHANYTIGYRFQKDKGGLIFRINYSPIIEFYRYYRNWGGISIGYAF